MKLPYLVIPNVRIGVWTLKHLRGSKHFLKRYLDDFGRNHVFLNQSRSQNRVPNQFFLLHIFLKETSRHLWFTVIEKNPHCTSYIFSYLVVEATHLKNMLVNLQHFPKDRVEHTKYLKPPPSIYPQGSWLTERQMMRQGYIITSKTKGI